jgi:hypothetical protein
MNITLNVSPIKVLMFFYLILMANLLSAKLNAHLIDNINNNKILKHIIIFVTIIVLLTVIYSDLNIYDLIIYGFIIYFVFILSTKMNKNYVMGILSLLVLFYLKDYYNKQKIMIIAKDQTLNGLDKEKKIENINKQNFSMNVIFGLLVVGGALLYDNKKAEQYGGGYSLQKFFNI